MIKIIVMLLLVMVTLGGRIPGDVNFDARVNVLDLAITSRIITDRYSPTALQSNTADMNKDGNIDLADIDLMRGIVTHGS